MKKLIQKLFKLFEKMVVTINGWDYIPSSSTKMLYINIHKYKGKEMQLNDGTCIKYGDIVGEIHIDNLKVNHIRNNLKTIFYLLEEEMFALAYDINNNKKFRDIKAFYGRTVLYPIAKKQGFTIVNISNGFSKFFIGIWENILRMVFKNDNKGSKKFLRSPKECWISKDKILSKYFKGNGKCYEKANF